jgi:DHA2 family multidrug resistance protein-like MFS transporter
MPEAEGLPVPQRYWALLVIMIGICLTVLDGAIVNVALPTLSQQLHASAAESIWAVNGYLIGTCILLLPMAALGEIVGFRKVYLAGVIVFALGSLACTLAPNLPVLVIARFLQGLGSAGVLSANGALLRHSAPPRLMGKAIGLNAFVIGVSGAAAPSIASAILAVASWRWLFAVNLPFCLAAIVLGLWALPHNALAKRRLDYVSASLTAVAFGSLIVGLDLVARGGAAMSGWGLLAICVVAGLALARREWRMSAPLLPIDLLRIPILGLSVATSATSFGAWMIGFITLPFMLQLTLGRTVVQTGLLMTVWPIAGAVASPIAGWLSDKAPVAILSTIGLASFALGMAFLAIMPPTVTDFDIVWRMAMCGAGFAFFQAPNNRTILLSAPRERSGAAGGLLSTARLTGQSLGAVLVALLMRILPMHAANIAALSAAGALSFVAAGFSVLRSGKSPPVGQPAAGQAPA